MCGLRMLRVAQAAERNGVHNGERGARIVAGVAFGGGGDFFPWQVVIRQRFRNARDNFKWLQLESGSPPTWSPSPRPTWLLVRSSPWPILMVMTIGHHWALMDALWQNEVTLLGCAARMGDGRAVQRATFCWERALSVDLTAPLSQLGNLQTIGSEICRSWVDGEGRGVPSINSFYGWQWCRLRQAPWPVLDLPYLAAGLRPVSVQSPVSTRSLVTCKDPENSSSWTVAQERLAARGICVVSSIAWRPATRRR